MRLAKIEYFKFYNLFFSKFPAPFPLYLDLGILNL